MLLLLLSFTFLIAITFSVFIGKLSVLYIYGYFILSCITFIAYAIDKSAARRKVRRTPEHTLHVLALLGGWPGALIAQATLRHKSKKHAFQVIFWLSIFFNLLWLTCLLSFK